MLVRVANAWFELAALFPVCATDGTMQLCIQILCRETIGTLSWIESFLLIALKCPPWIGKRKYGHESSVNSKSDESSVILFLLNLTVMTPFSRVAVEFSAFCFWSNWGAVWFPREVSIIKCRPLCSSKMAIIASLLAIFVVLLKPIPVHLFLDLVWTIK